MPAALPMLRTIAAFVASTSTAALAVKTVLLNVTLGGWSFTDEHGETWGAIGASTAETDAP